MNLASCRSCWAQLVVEANLTPLQSSQDCSFILENGNEKAGYLSTEGLCYRRVWKGDLLRLSLLWRFWGELCKGCMVLQHLHAWRKWSSPCLPANSGREHWPFTKHLSRHESMHLLDIELHSLNCSSFDKEMWWELHVGGIKSTWFAFPYVCAVMHKLHRRQEYVSSSMTGNTYHALLQQGIRMHHSAHDLSQWAVNLLSEYDTKTCRGWLLVDE